MKTFLNYTIFLLFACTVFTACQTKQEGSHASLVNVNGKEVINCNISEVSDTIDFLLSDLVENCEMVALETNDSSLFESVYHISISNSYIAIHSRGQMPIKLFNRQGKFIRNIGKIGRGPGEFNYLYGIQLDEAANRIYLTPSANATQLIVYSLDNINLPSIPLVYKQTKCNAYVENNVVTVLSMPFKRKDMEPIPIAYQQTTDGTLIQEIKTPEHLVINPRNEKGQFVGFNNEISTSFNGDAPDLYIMCFDTLYHYNTDANKLEPQFVTSFSDEKRGTWTRELKSHYWTPIFGKKGGKVIVNKKTLKSSFFKLKNDFYGGIESRKFYMSNHGWFVDGIQALQLMEKFEEVLKNNDLEPTMRKKIEKLQKQLNENDNEVLFLGKMK